jgi:hypothetical protein
MILQTPELLRSLEIAKNAGNVARMDQHALYQKMFQNFPMQQRQTNDQSKRDEIKRSNAIPFRFNWFSSSYIISGISQYITLFLNGTEIQRVTDDITIYIDAQNSRIRYASNSNTVGDYYLLQNVNQTYIVSVGNFTIPSSPVFIGQNTLNGLTCTRLAWNGALQQSQYSKAVVFTDQYAYLDYYTYALSYFGRPFDVGTELQQPLPSQIFVDDEYHVVSWTWGQDFPNFNPFIHVIGNFNFPSVRSVAPPVSVFQLPAVCTPLVNI